MSQHNRSFFLNWVLFSGLCSSALSPVVSRAAPLPLKTHSSSAWSTPQWGFLNSRTTAPNTRRAPAKTQVVPQKSPLSKSLLFDQSFDKVSYRPTPQIFVHVTEPLMPDPAPLTASLPSPTVFSNEQSLVASAVTLPQLKETAPKVQAASAPLAVVPELTSPPVSQTRVLASTKPAPAPSPLNIVENLVDKNAIQNTASAQDVASVKFSLPKANARFGSVVVISEESLMAKNPQPISGATIHWVGPGSGLISKSDSTGLAKTPYPRSHSIRFVVTAPGYLPALGYAVKGLVTPVILSSEKRLAPVLQSLGIVPDPERTLVLGKVIDKNLRPVEQITLDASLQSPFKIFYSLGSFGLFHPQAKATGAQGDFVISGLREGLQYIMPTHNTEREWPAFIGDFSKLPQVVTLTIQEASSTKLQTQVVDGASFNRPDAGIHFTLGGQRGVYIPDEEGFVTIKEVYSRSSVDLVEITSQGYRKTWLSPIAQNDSFPESVSLFSDEQLSVLFRDVQSDVDMNKGIVFGLLRPEEFRAPLQVQVYGADGKRNREARIYYFDSKSLRPALTMTDRYVQSFALANLSDGEWHVIVSDAKTENVVATQVVRVQDQTISEMQF